MFWDGKCKKISARNNSCTGGKKVERWMKQKETITNLKKVSNMKATKFISACAVLVALASCSNEHELSQQSAEDTPIRIQANVGGITTRAAGNIQGSQFEANEFINVYLFEKSGGNGSTTSYGTSGLVVFKTSDASGNMSPSNPSKTLYYPTSGKPVLAYAFYPALSSAPGYDIKNDATTFSVETDQSTPAAYKKSDLMFAKQVETAKTANPISLKFAHQLTKIKVILTPGDGLENVTGATIKMLNVNKTIALTMPTDYSTATDITTGSTSENVSTTGIDFGTVDETNGNAIIIVPQTVDKGTKLFEVSYNGGKYSYTLPNGDSNNDVTFAAKTEYTYNLTLTSGGLTVKSTEITTWDNGGNTNGDATLN